MKTRYWILTVILAAFAWHAGPAAGAAQQEYSYPWGKAETKADSIQDVEELLKAADGYRQECSDAFTLHNNPTRVETYGKESKAWYRRALELEPSNSYAELSSGYVDLIRGRATSSKDVREHRFASALHQFREALKKRPGYAQAYLYMAQVQALREEYTEAEANLRLILDSDIETSEVHAWLAYVLIKTERKKEAKKHVERAIEYDDPSRCASWCRDNKSRVE